MHKNQSDQSFADELHPNQILASENLSRVHLSSSANNQPQKRQRKQSTKRAKKVPQTNMSFTQPQSSSTSSSDSNTLSDYQQSPGQAFYRPTQYFPFGNAPPMQLQSTQLPFPFPFSPFYQQWLPPVSSQQYPQFGQYRQTTPTVDDFMSMTFQRNQNLSLPARMMSDTFNRSPFGLSESEPTYDPNPSQIGLTELSTLTVPEAVQSREYDRGAMSAFQIYERPPIDGTTDGMPEQSPNTTDQISTISNSDSPHSSHSTNEESNENAVNINCNRIGDKKPFDPSSVIDEKYDFSCVICQEKKKDTVLMPCRHLCVCEKCCENIDLCPLCRKAFDETLTVFS